MDAGKRHEASRSEAGTAIAVAKGSTFYVRVSQTPILPEDMKGAKQHMNSQWVAFRRGTIRLENIIFYNGYKQTCPTLLQKEISSLSSKSVCYISLLGKIVQTLSLLARCAEMRELRGQLSPNTHYRYSTQEMNQFYGYK